MLTVLLVFCLLLIARESFADDAIEGPQDGKVEVVYPAERMAPYKERRSNWSTTFGFSVDNIIPDKFRSRINNSSYDELFGSTPISLYQFELGLKYNFGLGGIGLSVFGGQGGVENNNNINNRSELHELTLTKYGGSLSYIMDNLFSEPYVAPFIEGQYYRFGWDEHRSVYKSESLGDSTGETDFTSALIVGILIQLNWLDQQSAISAQDSSGLENAYLSLFVSQYNTSESAEDPDFQTGTNYGGGIKLEF